MPENKNESNDGLSKFVIGLLTGILMTSGYVKWGWEKPAVLELPDTVTSSVLAATASEDLYDLSNPLDVRLRALEVIAQQRPDEVLQIDATELNYALLEAFYRRRARREATQLSLQWPAFDIALEKPALRKVLEQKYGTSEDNALKQAMLFAAFEKEPFLKPWIAQHYETVTHATLLQILKEIRRHPQSTASADEAIH